VKTLDLPSQEYIRRVTRWAQPPPEVKPQEPAKPHPLKGKPKASTITPAEVHEMRRLKMSGMLNKEIAEKMGRSYTAVQVIVTDLTKATRNESDQKRAIIRQLRERGATFNEITKATGAKKTEIQWAIKKPAMLARRSP
jgi:predicted DNA-binding protein (UPF0251 family)